MLQVHRVESWHFIHAWLCSNQASIHLNAAGYTSFQPLLLPQQEASGSVETVKLLLLPLPLVHTKPYSNLVMLTCCLIRNSSTPQVTAKFIIRGNVSADGHAQDLFYTHHLQHITHFHYAHCKPSICTTCQCTVFFHIIDFSAVLHLLLSCIPAFYSAMLQYSACCKCRMY